MTAKLNWGRKSAQVCLVCCRHPAKTLCIHAGRFRCFFFFSFDQERPCLWIVWTFFSFFLHRCFVLWNHLLNNVVWLTMDLVCVSFWATQSIVASFFGGAYCIAQAVIAVLRHCVSLKHNFLPPPRAGYGSCSPRGVALETWQNDSNRQPTCWVSKCVSETENDNTETFQANCCTSWATLASTQWLVLC